MSGFRRSLRLPITLGVVMILLVVVLTVGWILLAVFGAKGDQEWAVLYWVLLSVGTTFLLLVLVGVVVYLSLSIKAINLSRRQSNFIDAVTHELKSPIASLKLSLQTMRRRQLPADDVMRFCGMMLDDVERLDALVNHVLDAARLEQGGVAPASEEIDLAALIRLVAGTVCGQHQADPACVSLDLSPCWIVAPRGDVEIVLRNVLDNAVKYAGQPPQVAATLRQSDGFAMLQIADNGRGIPRDQRRHAFRRFVRLGSELERVKPGTGLGLYIVGMLVRRLRGRVSIDSTSPPDTPGTRVEIRFPKASAQPMEGTLVQS